MLISSRFYPSALIVLAVTGGSAWAGQALRVDGEYQNLKVKFSFVACCTPEKFKLNGRAFGAQPGGDNCRLTKITGQINGRPISIPKGAYGDLWNASRFSSGYHTPSNSLTLHIGGGDGGESYDVALHFIDGELKYRDVPVVTIDGDRELRREYLQKRK